MLKPISDKIRKTSGMGAGILALFFIGSLFIIASGGGGDGGGGAPAESANLSSDPAEVENALTSTVQTFDMVEPVAGVGEAFSTSEVGAVTQSQAPLIEIINRAQAVAPWFKTDIVPFAPVACDNPDGTMDLPDESDYSEADKLNAVTTGSISATAVYTNCVQGTVTVDGSMTVEFHGDFSLDASDNLIFESLDSLTISTSMLDFADTSSSTDFTLTGFDLSMDMSGSQETITMNGDIAGMAEGRAIYAGFYNLVIGFSNDASGEYLTIDGMLNNSGCLGGWVTVATTTPVFVAYTDPIAETTEDCPKAGVLTISAKGNTIEATINSNYTIDVTYNGTAVTQFVDCDAVNGVCTAL